MHKVLIVEDEILIADRIAQYLRTSEVLPAIEIIGAAPTVARAQQLTLAHDPALALVDIRLRGEGTGLDFARWLTEFAPNTRFIFLTSQFSDGYIQAAQALNPSGYLTKPIQPRSLCAMAAMALFSSVAAPSPKIELVVNDTVERFKRNDLLYVEADHVYAIYHFRGLPPVVVRDTMIEIEKGLPFPYFVRVHRSYIVGVAHITSRTTARVFIGDTEIPVSRSRQQAVKESLDGRTKGARPSA